MESDKYTSLFALVDSHLSQTSLKESASNTKSTQPISCPKVGSVSESSLFSTNQRIPIPSLGSNDTPIASVLAEQISNMLKAKERKQKEEEKLKLDEEMKKLKLEDDNYVIDLEKAIRAPCDASPSSQPELRKSGSFELLFKHNSDSNEDNDNVFNSQTYLPCITDMSYILKMKIKKGKCSAFGKVLTSRLKPVAAPYLKEIIKSDIPVFDFSTKSPCDLIKEKLRKPTSYSIQNCNMVAQFMMTSGQ